MAQININTNEITTSAQTVGQFTVSYQQNGYGAVIPVINGEQHPELMMGFVSEQDKEAGLRLLAKALDATNGNIPAAMQYMYSAATVAANDIKPDEAVTLANGNEITISYGKREAYVGLEIVANLEDLHCSLPSEAIKTLLVERAERYIAEMIEADDESYDDEAWF